MSEFAILNQIKNLNQKIIKKTKNSDLDNLILSLLNPDPKKRITWEQYFEHSFFKNKKRRSESISIYKEPPENIKARITLKKEIKKKEIQPIFKFIKKSEYIKLILFGGREVGKAELIRQFIHEEFDKNSISFYKSLEFPELGTTLQFDIWNIPSNKGYKKIIENFLQDTKVIIFVYDITNRESFEEIKSFWYSLYIESIINTNAILAVVANKEELYYNEQVSKEEGKSFADEIGAIFQLTSTKRNDNVNLLFYNIGMTYLTGDINFYKKIKNEKEEYLKQFLKIKEYENEENIEKKSLFQCRIF